MHQAAKEEDYIKASQLKIKRDKSYTDAMDELDVAEKKVEDLSAIQEESTTSPSSNSQNTNDEFKMINTQLEDLSLSTIHRLNDDDPSVAMAMTGRSFHLNVDERPIVSRQTSLNQSRHEQCNVYSNQDSGINQLQNSEDNDEMDSNGEHPLMGVPDYQNLPVPEELHDAEGGLAISLSSSSSIVSTDSILKIESILGRYRTKCFLSKNWALREAALVKSSMILPAVVETYKVDYPIDDDWQDAFLRSMFIILERAIDDKIVQVYLTGLILLDDCIEQIEKLQISQKEIISLLNNTIIILVDKMASSSQRVLEGAETALMSLALVDEVGPAFIGSQLMKRASPKGKSLCAKFRLLRNMIEEFEAEASSGQKVMEFVKTHGFGHKDAEVREAAKALTTAIYIRDGNIVLSMLEGLSERQIKEYKAAFANARKSSAGKRGEYQNDVNKIQNICNIESNEDTINRLLSPNPKLKEKQVIAPTPRGRGRGRGRRNNSQGIDRLGGIPRK